MNAPNQAWQTARTTRSPEEVSEPNRSTADMIDALADALGRPRPDRAQPITTRVQMPSSPDLWDADTWREMQRIARGEG